MLELGTRAQFPSVSITAPGSVAPAGDNVPCQHATEGTLAMGENDRPTVSQVFEVLDRGVICRTIRWRHARHRFSRCSYAMY